MHFNFGAYSDSIVLCHQSARNFSTKKDTAELGTTKFSSGEYMDMTLTNVSGQYQMFCQRYVQGYYIH